MNRRILLLVTAVPMVLATAPAFRIDSLVLRDAVPCEVPCSDGWCCYLGTVCKPAGGETPYVCIDQILTNSDGTPITWPADDIGSLLTDLLDTANDSDPDFYIFA
ncbi:hypothetical protein BX600DRAFT_555432 [Xylariales sp. PMI_506]|nr:hypothetical protein BX600DRAFT_555432 [Xylariales sp. PMI_506]